MIIIRILTRKGKDECKIYKSLRENKNIRVYYHRTWKTTCDNNFWWISLMQFVFRISGVIKVSKFSDASFSHLMYEEIVSRSYEAKIKEFAQRASPATKPTPFVIVHRFTSVLISPYRRLYYSHSPLRA